MCLTFNYRVNIQKTFDNPKSGRQKLLTLFGWLNALESTKETNSTKHSTHQEEAHSIGFTSESDKLINSLVSSHKGYTETNDGQEQEFEIDLNSHKH